MRSEDAVCRNRLLSRIDASESFHLMHSMQVVNIKPQEVIYELGEPIDHVYFPHSAILALMAQMQDGKMAGTATVGPEGLVGFEILLGKQTAMHTVALVSGTATRIRADELLTAIQENSAWRSLLLSYIGMLIVKLAQSTACNALHRVEERLSRWLLRVQHSIGCDRFETTQDAIAELLGVHRPTVTAVIHKMQDANLIRYSRGVLTVIDRDGIEHKACECYTTIKDAYDDAFARMSHCR